MHEEPRVPYLGAGAFQPQQLGQVVARRVIDGVLKHLYFLHQSQVIVVWSHLQQNTNVLREQPKTELQPRKKQGSGARQSWVLISPPQPQEKGNQNVAKGIMEWPR